MLTCTATTPLALRRTAGPMGIRPCVPRSQARRPSALVQTRAAKQVFGSFEEMIEKSELPILVDFYATWCGPCQMLAQQLGPIQTQLAGTCQVVKIDTEKYPGIAGQHNIQALPTLVLFKGGKPIDRIEGLPTQQQLVDRVRYMISKN